MRPTLPFLLTLLLLLLAVAMEGHGAWNESEPDPGGVHRGGAEVGGTQEGVKEEGVTEEGGTEEGGKEEGGKEEGGTQEGGWVLERVEALGGFLDTAVEYLGGNEGICRYTCGNGSKPEPRPGFVSAPNGCGSPVFGLYGEVSALGGVTRCCNRHDLCYARCGVARVDCDSRFRRCMGRVCHRLDWVFNLFTLSQGKCGSIMDAIHEGMDNLGCRPFLLSQREACVCVPSHGPLA
ncbi:group XIIA secretory phospholipase A2-like [Lampetra fluviatilis]